MLRFLDLRLPPASSVTARALSWTVMLAISLQVVEPFFSFLAPFVSTVAEPPMLGGRLPQIHSCIGVGHIDHLSERLPYECLIPKTCTVSAPSKNPSSQKNKFASLQNAPNKKLFRADPKPSTPSRTSQKPKSSAPCIPNPV